MFMFNQKDWGFGTVSVKINGGKTKESIAFIQSAWKKIFPDHPFEYQFLDDHFKDVYRTDAQITQMVSILAFLAILISCLGLFGLASYSAERRIKEIGVRKVLGASVYEYRVTAFKTFCLAGADRQCHCLASRLVYGKSVDAGLCLSFTDELVGIRTGGTDCARYCLINGECIGYESSDG